MTGGTRTPLRCDVVAQSLDAAEHEWRLPVVDGTPAGNARILQWITQGLEWRWVTSYRPNTFQECGAFVAWCLAAAGLHQRFRATDMSSVERIEAAGRYACYTGLAPTHVGLHGEALQPIKDFHKANGGLRLHQRVRVGRELAWPIEPGDVLLVGPDATDGAKGAHGRHVCLVRDVDMASGTIGTWEGNAGGAGPDGRKYTGAVRQTRPLPTKDNLHAYHVRTVVRWALADFNPSLDVVIQAGK